MSKLQQQSCACKRKKTQIVWNWNYAQLWALVFCVPAGELCRSKKVFLHTDAAQAVGKIPVDVNAMNIDLMSISGHKIYGPKGAPVHVCVSVCVCACVHACVCAVFVGGTCRCLHGQVMFKMHVAFLFFVLFVVVFIYTSVLLVCVCVCASLCFLWLCLLMFSICLYIPLICMWVFAHFSFFMN